MATGKFGDFARSYLRQARVECTNKTGCRRSPLRQTPKGQPDTAICSPSRAQFASVCWMFCDLGNWDLVATWFHNFPDFSGTGHGKNPEVSRQAPLL
ncbi:hypothetical protein EVAR_82194_1 [Eumeta japonica]|uniref:Uncharacterized protein n=1 Tax=Eumeta variegata TaxID=151549 RepID=A0A4C2AD04_EUMVA|nr:hypothetical protein EVAR_82194_1 [Eumeta japonica]